MSKFKVMLLLVCVFLIFNLSSAVLFAQEAPLTPQTCVLTAKFATDQNSVFDLTPGYTFADEQGNIYVINTSGFSETGIVFFKFNAVGGFIEKTSLALPFTPGLEHDFDFRYNRNGTLYVLVKTFAVEYDAAGTPYHAGSLNTQLYRFGLDGAYLGEVPVPAFVGAWEVSRQGVLYLRTSNQLNVYDADGSFIYAINNVRALKIALDPSDRLFTMYIEVDHEYIDDPDHFSSYREITTARLNRLDDAGQLQPFNTIVLRDVAYGGDYSEYWVSNFAIDSQGKSYFVDNTISSYFSAYSSLRSFAADGQLLGHLPPYFDIETQFFNKLFVDSADNLYASHTAPRYIYWFSNNGYVSETDYYVRSYTYDCPDTIPPVLTVLGDNPMNLYGDVYQEGHIRLVDEYGYPLDGTSGYIPGGAVACDADGCFLPVNVDYSTVNHQVPGSYTVYYSATDAHGNTTTATRTVNVHPSINVTSLTLIDSSTNQPITGFDPIPQNAVLNPSALPSKLNIRANLAGPVSSVQFALIGPQNHYQTENIAPYALFGDNQGNYKDGMFDAGVYTLTVYPFDGPNRTGQAGEPYVLSFSVTENPSYTLEVTRFVLVDATTNQDIAVLGSENTLIVADFENFYQHGLNIRAETNQGTTGSVLFEMRRNQQGLTGTSARRIENLAPYAIAGDNRGNYDWWGWMTGIRVYGGTTTFEFHITSTPYPGRNATGVPGLSKSIVIRVIYGGTPSGGSSLYTTSAMYTEPLTYGLFENNEHTPVEADVLVRSDNGTAQPAFSWQAPITAEWYNIVMVDAAGQVILDTWVDYATACAGASCAHMPGGASLPYGLGNGEYVWWMRAWSEGVLTDWGDEGVLTVENAPVPLPPSFDVMVQDGQPLITWASEPNTLWMQVYIGQVDGVEIYRQWHEAAPLCSSEGTCSLHIPLALPPGQYEVYLQPWGNGGFNAGGVQGWFGPDHFIIVR